MHTQIIKLDEDSREKSVDRAATVIKNGGLVVFPTETVYGLGANALDERAVSKIFEAKGRPSDNPIIVHVSGTEMLEEITDSIGAIEKSLIENFWPGPLTIIFTKKENISKIVSGGLDTVAVRMPEHPIAISLIKKSGVPIAAPSANISGRPSGTEIKQIEKELDSKVDLILDTGMTKIGVESTVVKVEGEKIIILRPGGVTKEMINEALGVDVDFAKSEEDLKASPGTRYQHYAPKAELIIVDEDLVLSEAQKYKKENKKVGILTTVENLGKYEEFEPNVFELGNKDDILSISHNMYKGLRYFDKYIVDVIICPTFKEEGLGKAVMDRLRRASAKNY